MNMENKKELNEKDLEKVDGGAGAPLRDRSNNQSEDAAHKKNPQKNETDGIVIARRPN